MHTLLTAVGKSKLKVTFFETPCAIWNTTGVTIAGTGVPGNSARQLSFPQNIFIRDKTKRLYVSDTFNNRIKIFPLDRSTTTVAGETGQKGPRADHLNEPQGICADLTTQTVYMTDLINHRVQKWPKDAEEDVSVAGSSDGDPGSDAKSLDSPYGLRVDEETKIFYVVDLLNHQTQRWKHGENEGDTIAGGNDM
ncbi:unnamed protein product [Rotaria socialis]|uniref:NHL repeat-containing protein 2 n=1 Tax=Rotaria socialis TaxID=392032 RepID=A0A820UZG0_9BILA|nr:unnamed protein product [Rotaria socialis]CAF4493269.1 unnamed protein product [Rotaria socialis]